MSNTKQEGCRFLLICGIAVFICFYIAFAAIAWDRIGLGVRVGVLALPGLPLAYLVWRLGKSSITRLSDSVLAHRKNRELSTRLAFLGAFLSGLFWSLCLYFIGPVDSISPPFWVYGLPAVFASVTFWASLALISNEAGCIVSSIGTIVVITCLAIMPLGVWYYDLGWVVDSTPDYMRMVESAVNLGATKENEIPIGSLQAVVIDKELQGPSELLLELPSDLRARNSTEVDAIALLEWSSERIGDYPEANENKDNILLQNSPPATANIWICNVTIVVTSTAPPCVIASAAIRGSSPPGAVSIAAEGPQYGSRPSEEEILAYIIAELRKR